MSGPTTAIFGLDPVSILLAAAALQATQAVREGYQNAANTRENQADQRFAAQQQQSEAAAAGQAALAERIASAQAEHQQLCLAAAPYGASAALQHSKPAAPADISQAAQAHYLEQLLALNRSLSRLLQQTAADTPAELSLGLSADMLQTAPERITDTTANEATRSARRAARLTARLSEILGGVHSLPPEILALEAEWAAAPSQERRELLEIELRRAIQLYQQQAAEKASARILEHSLHELGYQVEAIRDTLFVEGGVVHFRRAGWGDYQVRLRLNAASKTVNFNVVRAVDTGNNERSALDHIAEDRWCAEFPALLNALAARGVQLTVSRRLEAGELPVQLVERHQLPQFTDAEETRPQAAPLARERR